MEKQNEELLKVAVALREWIDAVPKETVLPAMPGVDRDWVDAVLYAEMERLSSPK
jgi:hypothetical protein